MKNPCTRLRGARRILENIFCRKLISSRGETNCKFFTRRNIYAGVKFHQKDMNFSSENFAGGVEKRINLFPSLLNNSFLCVYGKRSSDKGRRAVTLETSNVCD